jgi:hypothetical protein
MHISFAYLDKLPSGAGRRKEEKFGFVKGAAGFLRLLLREVG